MADSQVYMVAGLGNPGSEYSQTRHNIGFIALEEIARRYTLFFNNSKFNADIAKGIIEKKQTLLVKPQSYMNRSGLPVQQISSYFKIETDNIVVIHDELDLSFGRIMIVKGRGHGGHNGIRSLIESLGTRDFTRIRVGVGRPSATSIDEKDGSLTGYVLGKFAYEEQKQIATVVKTVADACSFILSNSVKTAMNLFNSNKSLIL